MSKSTFRKIVVVAGIALASPAMADSGYDAFNDRYRIYLGVFAPTVDSRLRINGDELPPVPSVSVEDALGVEDSKTVAWGGAQWRISRHHSLEFELFSLNRDGNVSGTFTPPIQLGDTVVESGEIATTYDTGVGRLTYGYSVFRDERMDFQVQVGLHLARLKAEIQASGAVCNPSTNPSTPPGCPAASTGGETEDITAPLPHFGASFEYAITPTVAVDFQIIGFALKVNSIEGSIIELDADVTWQPWRNFGFGAGVRYFDTSVKSGSSDLNGEFDFSYVGPVLFFQSSF